jgi:ribosomal protein L29
MDDARKLAIKENVNKFVEIKEEYITLGFQREILNDKLSQIKSELFEDRPKEYIEEVLAYFKNRKNAFGLSSVDMILEIEEWLKHISVQLRIE